MQRDEGGGLGDDGEGEEGSEVGYETSGRRWAGAERLSVGVLRLVPCRAGRPCYVTVHGKILPPCLICKLIPVEWVR